MNTQKQSKVLINSIFAMLLFFVLLSGILPVCVSANSSQIGELKTLPYVEPEVIQAFEVENQSEIRVVIELRDTSNITYESVETKEEKQQAGRQRNEYFAKIIESILFDVTEEEIRNPSHTGRVIGGYLTKQGLEKFKNDSRVETILTDKTGGLAEKNETTKEKTDEQKETEEVIIEKDGGKQPSFFQKIIQFFKKLLSLIGIK